jgi:hypothetical protein
MKKIVIIVILFITTLSCKAQNIVPVEKEVEYMDAGKGIPVGTYLKDVNNLMGKYLGIWNGTYNNNKYSLIISKYIKMSSGRTFDTLIIRYVITNAGGTILEDTRGEADGNATRMWGGYFAKDLKYYVLSFVPRDETCGVRGSIYVRPKNNNTQIMVSLARNTDLWDPTLCAGGKKNESLFPENGMDLTKQ